MPQLSLYRNAKRITLRTLAVAGLVLIAGGTTFITLRGNSHTAAEVTPAVPGASPAGAPEGSNPQLRLIAYYFHVTARCVTCRTIEAYAQEAVERGFAGELKSGAIEWRPVNIQLQENRHFIEDYRLYTRSVVLVKVRGGKEVEWRNLDKVWDLVWKKDEFQKYIQSNVRTMLGGA